MRRVYLLSCIVAVLLAGCQPDTGDLSLEPSDRGGQNRTIEGGDGAPVAYVSGRRIGRSQLDRRLDEAAGGLVFSEVVLGLAIERELGARGIKLSDDAIDSERQLIAKTLSDDEDEAARLLEALRERRGLGEQRFTDLLERNAGLRAMVADDVEVTEDAIALAYRMQYGPAARVRLITTDTVAEAQQLRQRAVAGEPFGELAALHSTDASAAQGGLLSPIRAEDASYPQALRSAIGGLEPGEVSGPFAVDGGFGLVKLDAMIQGEAVSLEEVREALAERVRRQAERLRMQRLARELMSEADVIVLDPTLKAGWESRRRTLLADD